MKKSLAPKAISWRLRWNKKSLIIQNFQTGYTAHEAWLLTSAITRLPFCQVQFEQIQAFGGRDLSGDKGSVINVVQ